MNPLLKSILKRLLIIFILTPSTVGGMLCVCGLFLFIIAIVLLGMPLAAILCNDYELDKFFKD